VLAIGFALALRLRPLREWLMAVYVVVLIFMLFGIGTLVHDIPRFPTTYVHAGIAETIIRTGELYPIIDGRFDWPVFFILLAFVTQILGLDHPIALAAWIPTLSNLLYLVPVLIIFSALTSDRRLVWLGVWLFFIGNWVGQDYLSPQGFNYLLYLTFLAILLRWFSPPSAGTLDFIDRLRERMFGPLRPDAQPEALGARSDDPFDRRLHAGLAVVAVTIYAVVVSSHQLTPFALLGGATALVIARRSTLRGLPIVMAVMLGFWLSFMPLTYLSGHLPGLVAEIGQGGEVATSNVAARVVGSPEHTAVVFVRLAMSAAVWLLAGLGTLRRLRLGYWDVSAALLGALPFGMILLQSYGGELILRVYLFSLPFVAFLAAALFYSTPERVSLRRSVFITAVTMLLMVSMIVARYGNERSEFIAPPELAAVDYLVETAGEDALIVSMNGNSPLGYRDLERRQLVFAFDLFREPMPAELPASTISAFSEWVREAAREETYLWISRSQVAAAEMFGRSEPGALDALIERLRHQPGFAVLRSDDDSIIFAVEPSE
jgi:hypothetical protein